MNQYKQEKCTWRDIRKLVFIMIVSFLCVPLWAQQVVTGVVNSTENDQPIPGVTVMERGTSNGTVTGIDGDYSIRVSSDATLIFSFIGYQSLEIPVGNRSQINVEMESDVQGLDEVVVIGYGTRRKANLTGSISTIESRNLDLNPVGNISQALQGAASGVNVTMSNTPGSNAKVRIRGVGTINNNNPLWIVDGIPMWGGMNQIPPDQIASMNILKDAASTAIYGARGANGVIQVTTKQGKKDQAPQINFSARTGVNRNIQKYDLMNPEEYGEMLWLQQTNSGLTPSHPIYGSGAQPQIPNYLVPAGADQVDLGLYDIWNYQITEANPEGTDWYDEIYNPGLIQDYNFTITGGSESTTYGISAGMLKEEGLVKKTGFDRFSLRTNINTQLKDWLEIGTSTGFSHTNNFGLQSDGGSNSPFGQLLELTAIMPVYDVMGNYSPVSRMNGIEGNNNPVGEIDRAEHHTNKTIGIFSSSFAKINFSENFSFKSLLGLNLSDSRVRQPLSANPESYVARPFHQLTEGNSQSRQWNWVNTLDYNTLIGEKHKLEVLLGTEAIESSFQTFSTTRQEFFLDNLSYMYLSAGEGDMFNSGSGNEWSLFSYFARGHYDLDNKFLFDATIRRDGSSRFGPQNRWGNFPSFSGAWILSQESFLEDSQNWLNFMKIRAGWGQSGNDQIGNYNAFTTFGSNMNMSFYPIVGSNNSVSPGIQSVAFGNPRARWESIETANIAVDATLFNFMDISVDFWQRKTNGMLYPQNVPFVYGRASIPSVNIGNMSNKGIDIDLNFYGSALNDELTFNINANFSHYKNELIQLSDVAEEAIFGQTIREQIYTRAETGTAFPQFFGYEVMGIFQNEEQANNHPPAFGQSGDYNRPGRFMFNDVNGDDLIDDDDRTYIGNPHPDLYSGLTANVTYRQFDFSAVFVSSIGNDILNLNRRTLDFNLFNRNRHVRRLYESWGSPYLDNNENATMPIAEENDIGSQQPSSYYVEDGSYLRFQSAQIGYNFPALLLNRINVRNARIYLMGTNLFTITGYTGLDPLLQTSDGAYGVDLGRWPTPQRFMVGINLGL